MTGPPVPAAQHTRKAGEAAQPACPTPAHPCPSMPIHPSLPRREHGQQIHSHRLQRGALHGVLALLLPLHAGHLLVGRTAKPHSHHTARAELDPLHACHLLVGRTAATRPPPTHTPQCCDGGARPCPSRGSAHAPPARLRSSPPDHAALSTARGLYFAMTPYCLLYFTFIGYRKWTGAASNTNVRRPPPATPSMPPTVRTSHPITPARRPPPLTTTLPSPRPPPAPAQGPPGPGSSRIKPGDAAKPGDAPKAEGSTSARVSSTGGAAGPDMLEMYHVRHRPAYTHTRTVPWRAVAGGRVGVSVRGCGRRGAQGVWLGCVCARAAALLARLCRLMSWSVMWRGVMWRGVMWRGVMWRGVMWCDVVWCDVAWCDVGLSQAHVRAARRRVRQLQPTPAAPAPCVAQGKSRPGVAAVGLAQLIPGYEDWNEAEVTEGRPACRGGGAGSALCSCQRPRVHSAAAQPCSLPADGGAAFASRLPYHLTPSPPPRALPPLLSAPARLRPAGAQRDDVRAHAPAVAAGGGGGLRGGAGRHPGGGEPGAMISASQAHACSWVWPPRTS